AIVSIKGGVGKTTTTVGLGSTLADLRGDRIIALDGNPDRGTLGERIRRDHSRTIQHLLAAQHEITSYSGVPDFTSQTEARLEVLVSDQDPAVSNAFSEQDYRDVSAILERNYTISLTDCGTGLLNSAMTGILALADQLVLISSAAVDGSHSA